MSMSFLAGLQSGKKALKSTETIVRYPDGTSSRTHNGITERLPDQSYGFVVDTAPDNVPACVLDDWLFLGSQDCVETEVFAANNIGHCLSIGIETPAQLENVKHYFIPCLDLPETDLSAVLDQTDDILGNVELAGERVLVHCNAGVSRSASVVVGFLMRRNGFTYADALALVKIKRPCCRPNDGFVRQLLLLND